MNADTRKRWLWLAKQLFRLLVLALVGVGVWHTVLKATADLAERGFAWSQIDPGWLLLAGVCYLAGMLPNWWFWHRVLQAMGQRPLWRETLRAFYIGHLGKYFPGKALVVVLRTTLVRSDRVDTTVAATSVFVETLSMMAVGAFVAAGLIGAWYRQHAWLFWLAIGLMLVSGLPTLPPIFRRLVRLVGVQKVNPQIDAALRGLTFRVTLAGWITMSLGWFLLGLSLWATLRAIPATTAVPVTPGDLPLLTACVALALVAGFLSLLPGGIGIRELVVSTLLTAPYGAGAAAISALILRLVWLLAELLLAGVLYLWPGRSAKSASCLSSSAAKEPATVAFAARSVWVNWDPMLTAVIPVYNEAESLRELHAELSAVARQHQYDLEIVLVDDGSTDASWSEIEKLAAEDPRVHGIRFRRNFGKAAALSAGFQAAHGELVFTLDADLQDDPQEMPRFLEQVQAGFDVVSGWKKVRHDPWHKVLPSRVFNWLIGWLTGVRLHDHNCGFKCYRREIFDEVKLYGEMHRFVPVLAASRGWTVGEIVVNHRPRKFGRSKYGVRRFVKGLLDLLTVYFLTGYGQRPQHLLGTLGLLSFLLGGLAVLGLTAWWGISRLDQDPANNLHLHERAIFYYAMGAMLLGSQFITVGILAEQLTAYHLKDISTYSIRQQTRPASEQPHE